MLLDFKLALVVEYYLPMYWTPIEYICQKSKQSYR